MPHLQKFLDAQNQTYLKALAEIRNGRKESHWMWYIFPQIDGLGRSETARYYALSGIDQAQDYLDHPILGKHLIEISSALLEVRSDVNSIFGSPDDLKLRSCMTLFANVPNTNPVFQKVLDVFFGGKPDARTIELLHQTA